MPSIESTNDDDQVLNGSSNIPLSSNNPNSKFKIQSQSQASELQSQIKTPSRPTNNTQLQLRAQIFFSANLDADCSIVSTDLKKLLFPDHDSKTDDDDDDATSVLFPNPKYIALRSVVEGPDTVGGSSLSWTLFNIINATNTYSSTHNSRTTKEQDQQNQQIREQENNLPRESILLSFKLKPALAAYLSPTVLARPVVAPALDRVMVFCEPDVYGQLSGKEAGELIKPLLYGSGSSSDVGDSTVGDSNSGGNDNGNGRNVPCILRQGDFCQQLQGTIKLCEPVDQGVVTKNTKITVVRDTSLQSESPSTLVSVSNPPVLASSGDTNCQNNDITDTNLSFNEEGKESDDKDENVKTSYMDDAIAKYLEFNDWDSSKPSSSSSTTTSIIKNNDTTTTNITKSSNSNTTASITDISPRIQYKNSLTFSSPITVKPLTHPIPRATIVPAPDPADDPESRAFVKIELLAELGCFSGDVVLLKTSNGQTRHITLFSYPEPNQISSRTVYISPILLYNLGTPKRIQIAKMLSERHGGVNRPMSSFGSLSAQSSNSNSNVNGNGNLRTAYEVTISRLASPVTTDRTLQQAFLSGLRAYFEGSMRVVKRGDVVVIPIDTIMAKILYSSSSSSSGNGNSNGNGLNGSNENGITQQPAHDNEDDNIGVVPQGKPNAIAWFKITSVIGNESDKDSENENGETGGASSSNESLEPDLEDFIINPSQTRMVQSGLVTDKSIPTTIPWREYLSLPLYPDYHITESSKALTAATNTTTGKAPTFEYAQKLQQHLSASLSPLGHSLQTTILIHSSKRGTGKSSVVHSVASAMGFHVFEIDGYSTVSENDAKTFGVLRARLERAAEISPCVVLIKHIDAIAKKSETDGKEGSGITTNIVSLFDSLFEKSKKKNAKESEENAQSGSDGNDTELHSGSGQFIIIATAADVDKLADSVRAKFTFEIDVPVPSEDERFEIFKHVSQVKLPKEQVTQIIRGGSKLRYRFALRNDVQLSILALQSAGLTPPDLLSILRISKQKAVQRLVKLAKQEQEKALLQKETTTNKNVTFADMVFASGGVIKISPEDIEDAIGEARRKYSDSIGAPRIPNVSWADVGGLEGVKKEILDTIEMPLKYPELFSSGMKKRSGILFYGPPGTGKTLLAKAIATTFSLNFFSVKGPELLNMYIGESEANVRRVFQKARDAKPCVVFFDELDSVAPKRGNQGDSGGVMDRIVSQLLAELDGMSGAGGSGVFVVGATNRPDLLDEALLRPGRFDKMLYLGVSDTHEKQKTILEALTRKFKLGANVSLEKVAEKCPFTFTGADFYAMCSDAMLNAMTRTAGEVDAKFEQYNKEQREAKGLKPVSIRWWFEKVATDKDIDVEVTEQDFDKSQRELVPSVSAEELQHYQRVRDNFQGGKTKAKQNGNKKMMIEGSGDDQGSSSMNELTFGTVGEVTNLVNGNSHGSDGSTAFTHNESNGSVASENGYDVKGKGKGKGRDKGKGKR